MSQGLIIDNFAGGGGASTGIEQAIGRPIDIAINHDPASIAMHRANHPHTAHYEQSIYSVDPLDVVRKGGPGGRNANMPVSLAWFSPDCKHHSKALGGKPRDKNIRDMAWVVLHWIERLVKYNLHPRVIMIENVEEFRQWGPLNDDMKPIPDRKGETFKKFIRKIKKFGYNVEYNELRASDYGAPTIRKRLFIICTLGNKIITWPKPTHGIDTDNPYRCAADIIDWSIPCQSIFERSRPLVETTMNRIFNGIKRFILQDEHPFIVPVTHTANSLKPRDINKPLNTITTAKGGEFALMVPNILRYQKGYDCRDIKNPLDTILTKGKLGLITAHIAQHNGGPNNKNLSGRKADAPLSTITSRGTQQQIVDAKLIEYSEKQSGYEKAHHVYSFIIKYYGNEKGGHDLRSPIGTVTTKDRFGLIIVTIDDVEYVIADIGMRMLTARELFMAQGFPEDYKIDILYNGKPMTKTSQIARCGNAVCPPLPLALIRANIHLIN